MCLSAVPRSASQITLAQRQSYNKTRPLNHISTAFYRPTPQLRHYETVYHTETCVSECVCVKKETVWEETRVCFTKRCWRLSCSPRHLTAFHLLLLLDQPRAAVTSPFPVLTSHTHTPSHAHTHIHSRADRWLTKLREDVLVGELVLCFVRAGEGRGRASRTTFQLKSQCGYANWTAD